MLWLEILPNLVPLLVTLLAVEMGIAILVEVILSFIGFRSRATSRPGEASSRTDADHLPGAVDHGAADHLHHLGRVGLNLLGDGLRHAIDPVMRS